MVVPLLLAVLDLVSAAMAAQSVLRERAVVPLQALELAFL